MKKDTPLVEQVASAKASLAISSMRAQQRLIESVSLIFGSGSATDLVNEDPIGDDGEVWTEVGLQGGMSAGTRHPVSERDLTTARNVGRILSQSNGFAIGAIEARISYIVGTGLAWRAVAKEKNIPKEATQKVNNAIKEFSFANNFTIIEQELVTRIDRDGEAFVRTFPNRSRPLDVRFVEPEDVVTPEDDESGDSAFGIKVAFDDVRTVVGYWVVMGDERGRPTLIPSMHQMGNLPQMLHLKANVDMNSRRGWPTLWAVRRNFSRAEKLLRNMSYVAALQAGIAMIRKHDSATLSQVQSFIDTNSDLLVTDNLTGKERRHTKMMPGTVFDIGPGTTYEAPVSSVNAEQNIPILQADLREIAAMLQMPEFMLTANAQNANLASSLVAEGPATKGFERLQQSRGNFLKSIIEAGLQHETLSGRLPIELLETHDIVATFPTVISRNRLNEAQRLEIEKRNNVVSVKTWRGMAGYDHDTEETNVEEDKKAAKEAIVQLGLNPGGLPAAPNPGQRDDDEEVGIPKS